MKNSVFAVCLVVCLVVPSAFGQSVGPWRLGITGYSLINREDTPGEAVVLSLDCIYDKTQIRSEFSGFDYLMFEDPSAVTILYRTDNSGIESLQWESDEESGEIIVAESYVDTWVSHLLDASEMTIQVTAGGYEYTHAFDVSQLNEALWESTCG
jgi:hypothetical protein